MMDEKFIKLEKKYSKLYSKHSRLLNKINIFEKMPKAVINGKSLEGIYFKRVSNGSTPTTGIIYIKNTEIGEECCDICGQKKQTTGHHLIPRRIPTINKYLSLLRVRVCDECNDLLHPENLKIDTEGIIYRQNKIIKEQQYRIDAKVEKEILPEFIGFIDKKIGELEKGKGRIPSDLKEKNNIRKIHPALMKVIGRIIELKFIRTEFKRKINNHFGTKK